MYNIYIYLAFLNNFLFLFYFFSVKNQTANRINRNVPKINYIIVDEYNCDLNANIYLKF